MSKILITGATGTIGKELIEALRTREANVVAGVRDTDKATRLLGEHTPVVYFDYADKESYAAATAGVDKVFVLGPPLNPALGELVAPFLDFLKQQDILRVVYLSANGAENMGSALPFHPLMENKLKREGFIYTILRPSFFSQNFKNYEWENIKERGIIYAPAGSGKTAFVDVRDIARVAAIVLTEEGHEKQTYTLSGPEALTYHQAASVLSQVLGKNIQYPEPTAEQFTQTLLTAGAPAFIATYLSEVYGAIANGHAAEISNDIARITGRKPNSLQEALELDFGVLV